MAPNRSGSWTLTVSDETPGDAGVLAGWTLQLTTTLGCVPKSEFTVYALPQDARFDHDLVLCHLPTNQHVIWHMSGTRMTTSQALSPQPAST